MIDTVSLEPYDNILELCSKKQDSPYGELALKPLSLACDVSKVTPWIKYLEQITVGICSKSSSIACGLNDRIALMRKRERCGQPPYGLLTVAI